MAGHQVNITDRQTMGDTFNAFLKRRFCGWFRDHRSAVWVRNIYGDEINLCGGCRSLWQCTFCKAFIYERGFHQEHEG